MVVRMNNPKENDYDIFCDNCGSEEICDHELPRGSDLQSVDYCEECCPRCDKIGKCGMCNQEKELMPDDYDTCNSCMFGEQD